MLEKSPIRNYLIIPEEAVKYILFQRTGIQRLPGFFPIKFLHKLIGWPSYHHLVALEAKIRRGAIKKLYEREIQQDFNEIKDYLPEHVSSILDVGCGIAGIDVLLFQHYQSNNDIVFYLLDKTEIAPEIYYWFKSAAAFYNSLKVSENILIENGINKCNIGLLEADPDNSIDIKSSPDLIISLFSWGFHYPIATYLNQIYSLLNAGGHLILDLRKGMGGEKDLESKFNHLKIISEKKRSFRLLAIK